MAAEKDRLDAQAELPDFLDELDPELRALLGGEPEPEAPPQPRPAATQKLRRQPEKPKKQKAARPSALPAVLAVLSVLLAAAGGVLLYLSGMLGGSASAVLPEGARIGTAALGGMTRAEAVQTLKDTYPFGTRSVVLELPGTQVEFAPEAAAIRAEDAVDALLAGKPVNLADCVTVDEAAVRSELERQAAVLSQKEIPAGYTVTADSVQITMGTSRMTLDVPTLTAQVASACRAGQLQLRAESGYTAEEAEKPDLDAIFSAVAIPVREPQVDHTTLQIVPGENGLDFDLEQAKMDCAAAQPGQTVTIPLRVLEPTISQEDAWFQDELGYARTPHGDSDNRNFNLALACSFLDGYVIQPGEIFSYNAVVGERTPERGFKNAPAYSGTVLVDSPGGGVCQVSSTLFLATLYAELETVERVNHGFAVRYIPIGLDATVNWGTTDLKFKNTMPLPIRIKAEVVDGFVCIRLMGTELRDYYVKIEYRAGDGRYTSAYTCRYNPETDERIYREFHHRSAYLEDIRSQYGWIRSGEATGTLIG